MHTHTHTHTNEKKSLISLITVKFHWKITVEINF